MDQRNSSGGSVSRAVITSSNRALNRSPFRCPPRPGESADPDKVGPFRITTHREKSLAPPSRLGRRFSFLPAYLGEKRGKHRPIALLAFPSCIAHRKWRIQ